MTIHNDIDKVFKEGLADHSHKPPPFVWDNIQNNLNRKRTIKRRSAIYSIAAAGALLISFGAGYMFNLFNVNTSQMAQNSNQTMIVNEPSEKDEASNTTVEIASPIIEDSKDVEPDKAPIEPENSINSSSSTIESEKTIPAVKEEKKNTTTKKPKAKKAISSGTLLPPMYASEAEFESNSEINSVAPVFIEEENNDSEAKLIKMKAQKGCFDQQLAEPTIKNTHPKMYAYNETVYNAPKQKVSKWGVGLNATPLISYRDVASNADQNIAVANNISSYDQNYSNEQPLVSYSAGVDLSYGVSSRWKVHSGIYISEIGQVTKDISVTSNNFNSNDVYAINTSASNINVSNVPSAFIKALDAKAPNIPDNLPPGSPIPPTSSNVDLVYTLNYYEIPLMVSYKVINRKLGVNVSGGLSANILYNNSTYLTESGEQYDINAEIADLKSTNYNGVIGLGMDYPIITQLHFNLQPTLRYSLSPINISGTVYPYSFGVYTGLKYSF